VFKKFEKHNLFQMSCSDVRERFHLLFLLTVVGVRNLTEFAWNLGLLNVFLRVFLGIVTPVQQGIVRMVSGPGFQPVTRGPMYKMSCVLS